MTYYQEQRRGNNGMRFGGLIIGLMMAAFAFIQYHSNTQVNEFTGEKQRVSLSPDQEIQLGLQSAPSMAQQHGGLHPDQSARAYVKQVGQKLVQTSVARQSPYEYDFHLLADPRTVNAFALPGGQIFITAALYSRLESEDQLAGILGHEIGHVIERHAAERIAKQELSKGLTGAVVAATQDYNSAQYAQMISNTVNMKYGRDQELESDQWGVKLMVDANYDPNALKEVMKILEQASGGQQQPEFMSSHPSPENRIGRIDESIQMMRQGVDPTKRH